MAAAGGPPSIENYGVLDEIDFTGLWSSSPVVAQDQHPRHPDVALP
jgi:hypothetical protein